MAMCYVARKSCGCIVAAFPVAGIDAKHSAEILKQLVLCGYSVQQAGEGDVRKDFHLTCDHNRPPLLDIADKKVDPVTGEVISENEPTGFEPLEDGADAADVEAMAEDYQGDGEEFDLTDPEFLAESFEAAHEEELEEGAFEVEAKEQAEIEF